MRWLRSDGLGQAPESFGLSVCLERAAASAFPWETCLERAAASASRCSAAWFSQLKGNK